MGIRAVLQRSQGVRGKRGGEGVGIRRRRHGTAGAHRDVCSLDGGAR